MHLVWNKRGQEAVGVWMRPGFGLKMHGQAIEVHMDVMRQDPGPAMRLLTDFGVASHW